MQTKKKKPQTTALAHLLTLTSLAPLTSDFSSTIIFKQYLSFHSDFCACVALKSSAVSCLLCTQRNSSLYPDHQFKRLVAAKSVIHLLTYAQSPTPNQRSAQKKHTTIVWSLSFWRWGTCWFMFFLLIFYKYKILDISFTKCKRTNWKEKQFPSLAMHLYHFLVGSCVWSWAEVVFTQVLH